MTTAVYILMNEAHSLAEQIECGVGDPKEHRRALDAVKIKVGHKAASIRIKPNLPERTREEMDEWARGRLALVQMNEIYSRLRSP